jgi:peptide/nickel transport system ATP-binding protein
MNKGKIEEIDYADEIYYHPKQAYTQKLIAAIPKGDIDEIKKNKQTFITTDQ